MQYKQYKIKVSAMHIENKYTYYCYVYVGTPKLGVNPIEYQCRYLFENKKLLVHSVCKEKIAKCFNMSCKSNIPFSSFIEKTLELDLTR